MKETYYICGHKNPDTDSICSALAYADFKNKTENITAIPIRLGELNRETKFILDYFDLDKPKLMETMKAQVRDLQMDKIAPISPEISMKTAWNIMKKENMKTMPLVNNEGVFEGVVSISDLTTTYMDIWNNYILGKSCTTFENIIDTLSGKTIIHNKLIEHYKGKILVTAMEPSSAKELIEEGDIIICGNRLDSIEAILEHKISLLILTGNFTPTKEIIEKAKKAGCSVISTPHDTFTTSRLIIQSIPVKYVMSKDNLVSFKSIEFVEDIREVMAKTRYRSYPVLNTCNRVIGTISRYHLISQKKKKLILVDHNELSQSIDGAEDATITEIIDHHRIADVQTGLPIYFRNEPVGSTATIVANIFFENGLRPSRKIAGILAAAIISDTLLFRSPTSTNIDKIVLNRLADIANIDVDDFADKMFKAGTSIENKSIDEIFNGDFKSFTLLDKKIGVSQINTMNIEQFECKKEELLNFIDKKASIEDYDILVLMLTDILNGGSNFLVSGKNKDILANAFNKKLVNNELYVEGVLSRKKQVIPPISTTIENLR
ncbi:putative manganese-dependent inorganic diphosphatase [Clostridium sediminicola]|uniref:putative manganese-dependent inorganic diphosphatase n=1 Tax=Clostridium sediminicola TaxID=3114879 RepID=UPI0031F24168